VSLLELQAVDASLKKHTTTIARLLGVVTQPHWSGLRKKLNWNAIEGWMVVFYEFHLVFAFLSMETRDWGSEHQPRETAFTATRSSAPPAAQMPFPSSRKAAS
jgi:hypothetical protein